jgi:hypothetical protein
LNLLLQELRNLVCVDLSHTVLPSILDFACDRPVLPDRRVCYRR